MSKKTKTETNSTMTSTPTNPQWVADAVQGTQKRIDSLLATDAQSMVPGASALQTQAFDTAGSLGQGTRAIKNVLDQGPISTQSATSRGLLDVDLKAYENPYLESVVNTTLGGYDEQAGMERARLAGQHARNQKFANSGSVLESAMFERGNLKDRAATEAGLRSAGFDKATGLATVDLNRDAETSRFNAGQANAAAIADRQAQLNAAGMLGESERADLGVLSSLGGEQRDIERERLGAEAELLKLVSALNSNQGYGLFQGQTRTGQETSTSKTSDPMGTLTGLLGAAGSVASGLGALGVTLSDKRLKTDIETVGKDGAGRRLVSYRYKGEPEGTRRLGHIAQEVKKTDPHAIRKVGKHLAIDYGVLGDVA